MGVRGAFASGSKGAVWAARRGAGAEPQTWQRRALRSQRAARDRNGGRVSLNALGMPHNNPGKSP